MARRIQAAINDIDSIKIEDAEEVEQLIFDKKLSGLLNSKGQFYHYGRSASHIPGISNSTSDLEQSISAIKKTLDVDKTLSRAKEALDDMQKTTTIKFSDELSKEYTNLQNKYFKTGIAWQIGAIVSFISIFCVLFHHQAEPPKTIIDTNGSIGNSFVFSVYALNPIFAKIGLIIFFGAMAGVCLRIYSEYKRLSQEYRQKSLLAKNLLTGHDVLKPYIGNRIDTAFILPTIEKILEDPLTKSIFKQRIKRRCAWFG